MGKTQLLLLTALAIAAVTFYSLQPANPEHNNQQFELWKSKYNKKYCQTEVAYRFGVWIQNLAYVQAHNAKHQAKLESYNLQMNEFADLPSQQFAAKYLISYQANSVTTKCTGAQALTSEIAAQADWSTKGAVTPVKNQGQCGSCWAFSATGSLQGAHFLAAKSLTSFSQQQLVDCSHSYGNNGCGGGLMNLSFFYVKDQGITTQAKYPYKGVGSTCKYTAEQKQWTISDCTEVTVDNQKALLAAITKNPVSVAIQANHLSFQLYKGGVYTGNCGTKLDHGVLAVGYGQQKGKGFFKVKNSWGATWGTSGYILIERTGDGKGKCGIQMAASYPIA